MNTPTKKESPVTELLTIAQVCEYLNVPHSMLNKWRTEGRGPRTKKLPNGAVRIRRDWLESRINDLPEAA